MLSTLIVRLGHLKGSYKMKKSNKISLALLFAVSLSATAGGDGTPQLPRVVKQVVEKVVKQEQKKEKRFTVINTPKRVLVKTGSCAATGGMPDWIDGDDTNGGLSENGVDVLMSSTNGRIYNEADYTCMKAQSKYKITFRFTLTED